MAASVPAVASVPGIAGQNMHQASLRSALMETLVCLMSSDAGIRAAAEQRIKAFEVTDDYGSHLTDIVLTAEIDWPIRQLSVLLLKQYIVCHWTHLYEKFEEPEVNAENKERIRSALLSSLSQEGEVVSESADKRLKSGIAFAVYAIAHYDWPDEWPDLMHILIAYVTSGNRSAVYAGMKVIVDMCHEITESQMAAMAPLLLPHMMSMVADDSSIHSLRTRGRAAQVIGSMMETLALLCHMDRSAGSKFLHPILPDLVNSLIALMQVSDSSSQCMDIGLRKDLLSCLTIIVKNFGKRVTKSLPLILSTVWNCLTAAAVTYVNTVVNSGAGDADDQQSQPVTQVHDSDGEVMGQEAFIFSLFDFVNVLIESPKTRKLLTSGMSELIYFLMMFVQVTEDQVSTWTSDPESFVEDEDEDSFSFSVRLSALDLLMSLATEYEQGESREVNGQFLSSLLQAIGRHLMESDLVKQGSPAAGVNGHSQMNAMITSNNNNSHSNWWKIQESCLLVMGSLSESLVDLVMDQDSNSSNNGLRVTEILDSVLATDFLTYCPFLTGRCLWTAARFTPIFLFRGQVPVLQQLLHVTTASLSHSSAIVKVSAVRAVFSFSSHLKDQTTASAGTGATSDASSNSAAVLMLPYLSAIVEQLVTIGTSYSSQVLSLVLETLCLISAIDPGFTAANEQRISPLAIASFLRHSSDPVIVSCCQNVFKELCKNAACAPALQSRLGPTLRSILRPGDGSETSATTTTLCPVALDILTSMARSSPVPFSDLMMSLLSAAVTCILSTADDNACLQNGGECVRAFVSRSPSQVLASRFDCGSSSSSLTSTTTTDGVQMVMQVCLHLLDPRVAESCCAFVGRLVSIAIGKAGGLLGPENVHLLLRSVLSKVQTAESLSVIQSLVLVFAHLMHFEMQTVLSFLSSIPGPSGSTSALHFLLALWLSRQHLFYGNYEKKVSILALAKLLQHSVMNTGVTGPDGGTSRCNTLTPENLNLNLIQVSGDPIEAPVTGIRTRSKSRAVVDQWTQVPASVKILKILIAEIRNLDEARDCTTNPQDDDEYDDDDDEEDGSEGHCIDDQESSSSFSSPPKDRLSSLCVDHGDEWDDDDDDLWDDDDDDEDEDEAEDELSEVKEVNLTTFLSDFMRSFKQTSHCQEFLSHLNDEERSLILAIH